MSTLIGVFGWKASQAQPEMVEQFVVSCMPLYAGAVVTVKKTVVEATAPWLSVALAVSWYCPAATLLQMTLFGAPFAVPMSVAPWKNSTLAMLPSESAAAAVSVMVAPSVNTALLAGAVMLTVGAALTITLTAAEVVTTPLLSVARAVSVCVPAAALASVTL